MEDLPNSRELKCYLYCLLVGFGLIKANTTTLDPIKFLEVMDHMTTAEQNRFYKLGGGCFKKKKDLCEFAYQMSLCSKRNSNDDFYVLWRTDLEPGP